DNIAAVFFMLVVCSVVGVKDTTLQWYIVQTAQLVFLQKHLSAFKHEKKLLHFSILGGPGEAFFLLILVKEIFFLVKYYQFLKKDIMRSKLGDQRGNFPLFSDI